MLAEGTGERVPLQVGWAVPAAGAVRTRWDYLTLQTDAGEIVSAVRGGSLEAGGHIGGALEALGADDWELVSVAPGPSGGYLYVFKRPAAGR